MNWILRMCLSIVAFKNVNTASFARWCVDGAAIPAPSRSVLVMAAYFRTIRFFGSVFSTRRVMLKNLKAPLALELFLLRASRRLL